MLIWDKRKIGEKLYKLRKQAGLTQGEVAEKSGLADRTYADIERGVNSMRVETLLKLCRTFCVNPNDILTENDEFSAPEFEELFARLKDEPDGKQKTAYAILNAFMNSYK